MGWPKTAHDCNTERRLQRHREEAFNSVWGLKGSILMKRPPAQRRKSWTGKKKRRGNNGADSKDQQEEKRRGVRAQHMEDLPSSREVCIVGRWKGYRAEAAQEQRKCDSKELGRDRFTSCYRGRGFILATVGSPGNTVQIHFPVRSLWLRSREWIVRSTCSPPIPQ